MGVPKMDGLQKKNIKIDDLGVPHGTPPLGNLHKIWGQREGNENYQFESGKGKPTRLLNEAAERTHWFLLCWHAAGQFYGVILAWYQIGFFQVKRSGTKSDALKVCCNSSGTKLDALQLWC